MIEGANKTKKKSPIKESRKDYFLLVINHRPIGISTRYSDAIGCAELYAKKYNAKEISSGVWKSDGVLITVERIKRIKTTEI